MLVGSAWLTLSYLMLHHQFIHWLFFVTSFSVIPLWPINFVFITFSTAIIVWANSFISETCGTFVPIMPLSGMLNDWISENQSSLLNLIYQVGLLIFKTQNVKLMYCSDTYHTKIRTVGKYMIKFNHWIKVEINEIKYTSTSRWN